MLLMLDLILVSFFLSSEIRALKTKAREFLFIQHGFDWIDDLF